MRHPRTLAAAALAAALAAAPAADAQTVFTVAGSGRAHNAFGAYGGDGGLSTRARLFFPTDVSPTENGGFLIADQTNHRIRVVKRSGRIATLAGTGRFGSSGDGGPAARARLNSPTGVASLAGGAFLIADTGGNRIRLVDGNGVIRTVAGDGTEGFRGDGGPATAAALRFPSDVVPTPDGGLMIADSGNHRVRLVSPDGRIRTVAGSGPSGVDNGALAGDGGPAASARLNYPSGVAVHGADTLLIADTFNNRIRRVSSGGRIETVAGSGAVGEGDFSGDRGPATTARLNAPLGVDALPDSGFVVADTNNQRVRIVEGDGTIRTVAGRGPFGFRLGGFAGDGFSPGRARLSTPFSVAVTPAGGYLVADTHNQRVREIGGDRLAVALRSERESVRAGRALVIRFTVSSDASAVAYVARAGRRVARVRRRVRRGSNRLRLPARPSGRRLRPGRHTIEVVVRARGAATSDRAALTVRR